jgi:hypothetical protein
LAFIESEGHKTDVEIVDPKTGSATIRLRVRGQIVTVGTSERDETYFSVSIAYELPEWARDVAQSAPIALDVQSTFKAVKFFYAHQGEALVSAVELFASNPESFASQFWRIVSIARDAGNAAVSRILDITESKAAAEKFIHEFMRGQEP